MTMLADPLIAWCLLACQQPCTLAHKWADAADIKLLHVHVVCQASIYLLSPPVQCVSMHYEQKHDLPAALSHVSM